MENLSNDLREELDKLPYIDELMPIIEKEAESKNLKVFTFQSDELKKHFTIRIEDIAMITISSNEDTALWNIKNFRHSFLVKTKKKDVEILEPEVEEV